MTRRVVRCTACAWSGRRTSAGGPCPECAAPVTATDRGRGHPPSGRVELRCRVLASTAEAISPREAAALLDAEAARRVLADLDQGDRARPARGRAVTLALFQGT